MYKETKLEKFRLRVGVHEATVCQRREKEPIKKHFIKPLGVSGLTARATGQLDI